MKSIITFLLLIGFSLATFTPQWVVNNPYNHAYNPTNVTIQSQPTPRTYDYMTVCGDVQIDFSVSKVTYAILDKGDFMYAGLQRLTREELKAGSQYCFNFQFLVPYVADPEFTVSLILSGHGNLICGVDVDVPYSPSSIRA